MFPFSTKIVKKIIIQSMADRTTELIDLIKDSKDDESLVRTLKDQKPLIFFRVSLITNERKVLYDTHTKRILGSEFSQDFIIYHPEVIEALEKGSGYNEEYSEILGQKFAYFAQTFDFHGNQYILRTSFPYKYVAEVTDNFEIGFLFLATGGLLLFSLNERRIFKRFWGSIRS